MTFGNAPAPASECISLRSTNSTNFLRINNMFHILKNCLLLILLNIHWATYAEVTLDGTLGPALDLKGPRFVIEANLGKQVGNNLFHSFQRFNLNSQQAAIFNGPDTINHLISRVTGGESSYIDGTLYSTMPNADMYFINPAGILFGPNARLNIPGSLHVSTADYLRLGEEGRFDATHPERSLLKVAPPSAFGFLDDSPAAISKHHSFLDVPKGKTLSLIGGDLTLQDGLVTLNETTELTSFIRARDGQINLVSVASPGEVPIDPEKMPDNAFERFGTILIEDTTTDTDYETLHKRRIGNVYASGAGGGKVYIIGGQIILNNAYIFADTLGEQDGQGITVKATDKLELAQGARLTTQVVYNSSFEKTTGKAGNITIEAGRIILTEGSQIDSTSQYETDGAAGNITVSAQDAIEMSGFVFTELSPGKWELIKSGIVSTTATPGNGGQVTISTPTLTMTDNAVIRADTQNSGDAGHISITVDTVTLTEGAQIKSSSGQQNISTETGRGGTLTINAKQRILIAGDNSALLTNTFTRSEGGTIKISAPNVEIRDNGTIQAGTRGDGNGGYILLNVDTLYLEQGGFITTDTANGSGRAGNIQIKAHQTISVAEPNSEAQGNLLTKTMGAGEGGKIDIETPLLTLYQQGIITSQSTGLGNAGTISIKATELSLRDSAITTQSEQSGGGDISVEENNQLSLVNSKISAKAQGIEAYHHGGNLTIKHPWLFTLDNSELRADAQRGNGGNINIKAAQIRPLGNNVIDASSQFGLNGRLFLNDIDISETVIPLSIKYLAAEKLLPTRCAARSGTNLSSFIVTGPEILPESPHALSVHIPSQLLNRSPNFSLAGVGQL
ncbi:MAG: hypothetical protein DRR08_28790 [Candidatus Parabeggiatoa sp. nov. 2]|nr:MAG: hypothetical protein B6247_29980 [Beggiatoa sp. 4572_84]RKZ51921.1 MAG: hypothetical protein DRR08_28790 [Gammaproteobacteria bacterium]